MANSLESYRAALRKFLKDSADLNRLLNFEEESGNEHLDLYLNISLGFLNVLPPAIQEFTVATFPFPGLLIHQSAIEALISNSIVQARNDLSYNNGGVTVRVSNGDRYLALLQRLYRMADMEIATFKQLKVAMNINSGWGGSYSPYSALSTSNLSLNVSPLF